MKETCAIYMAYKILSYFMYDAKVTIKCGHAPLQKFHTLHTLNSKATNWGTEIAIMNHVTFEGIKGTADILQDHIFRFGYVGLYNVLDSEEGGKEFGHFIFKEVSPYLFSNIMNIHQIES